MSAQPVTTTTARDPLPAPTNARRVPSPGDAQVAIRPRSPAPEAAEARAPDASVTLSSGGRLGLSALLAETAYAHPHRIALIDPAGKQAWSGRRPITWTYASATEIVARLANGLRGWRLPRGARLGLSLAGGAESAIAYLAIEAAGYTPCLLSPSWSEDEILAAVQSAGIAGVLCQAKAGTATPAQTLCRVAARYFGLRYLAAFGPDVPDGVISLDGMALDGTGGAFAAEISGGLVSFAGGDPSCPVHRSGDAILAAIAFHRTCLGIAQGDRILTLLPFGDLRALVTGLGTALTCGASLETMPLFFAGPFAEALARPVPTHLVAPAGLEANLAASRLPDGLRSLTLAHRAPCTFPIRRLRPGAANRILDVVAFDEVALLSGERGVDDVARTLADPDRAALPESLIAIRSDEDGRLAFSGHACRVTSLRRGEAPADAGGSWRETPFRATVQAGRAKAINAG
ncbi:AMP-binding protein [Methylobacterium sp.]|uniref:AMP-binding protein n=1 Tax=Methylobacterium sp. TaxID=409 RepID=UPI0025DE713F|nr:AMP-binding protein [Methylobacterium sp.]